MSTINNKRESEDVVDNTEQYERPPSAAHPTSNSKRTTKNKKYEKRSLLNNIDAEDDPLDTLSPIPITHKPTDTTPTTNAVFINKGSTMQAFTYDNTAVIDAPPISSSGLNSPTSNSSEEEAQDEATEIIGQYGTDIWRIPLLLAYVVIMSSKSYMWISFSTIIDSAKDFYDISTADVNTIAVTYNYCYMAAFWVPGVVFPRLGLKWGLALASGLCMLGAVCRLLTIYALYKNYTLLVVGNVFAGMCQVIVLAAPPLVSNTWFPANERPIATAVGSAAVFLGGGVGMLAPTYFVNKDHQDKEDFASLHWFSFCFASFGFLCMVFLPKAPRIPPSPAALKQHGNVITSPSPRKFFSGMKRTLKAMFTNKSFVLLSVMACASVGVSWELPALIPQMAKPFGVSSTSAGWAGFACEAAGFIATVCIGVILTKTNDYKKVLLILSIGCLISVSAYLMVFAFGMETIGYEDATATTIVCWIALMIFSSAAFPVCFEIMAEVTFPLSESTTGPILIFLSSVSSLVFTEGFAAVLGESASKLETVIVLAGDAGILLFGAISVSFMTLRYKRRDYEARVHEHSAPGSGVEEGVEEVTRTTSDGHEVRIRRSLSHSRHGMEMMVATPAATRRTLS